MSLCNREASVVRLFVCRPSVNFFAQIATSTTNMTGSPPNLHTMVLTWTCIQDVLKVKDNVIRTLLWFHENRLFSQANGWIATKLAHDGPHIGLHPGCAHGQGQGQRTRDTDTFLISRKSLLLPQTWLDRQQTYTTWSPQGPASRICSRSRSRSKVTWYGHFCDVTKCLLYSTFWRFVSTCTHFMKHRYTLLPVQVSDS